MAQIKEAQKTNMQNNDQAKGKSKTNTRSVVPKANDDDWDDDLDSNAPSTFQWKGN